MGRAELIMWLVRTPLNGARLICPNCEVTLSFQPAQRMNRAPCQRPAGFISEAEGATPPCLSKALSPSFCPLHSFHSH